MNIFKVLPVAPEQASERAFGYDLIFWTITILAVVFTILVFALVLALAVRYRRGSSADRRYPVYHSNGIEAVLTLVPLVLGLGIFAWSSADFVKFRQRPKESMEIFVIGKQWMWHLQHMNGIRENNELHIPVDTPITMTMISQDVIHAMYIPAFRVQYHVVPGRYTEMSFTATKPGRYKMLCAMHCGTQHSEMVGFVYVMSKSDYARWIEGGGNRYEPRAATMVAAGEQVWNRKACGNCHAGMDTVRGPTLNGIFNAQRRLTDGSTAKAAPDYLRESILLPWLRLTKGYETTMPAYKGQLTEEEVLQLIEYIKSNSNTSTSGSPQPYSAPGARTLPTPTHPENATNRANRYGSAGVTQSEEGAMNAR